MVRDPVKLPPAKAEAHFDLKLPRDPMALLPLMSHYIRYRVPRWDTDTHVFVIRLQVPFHNLATLLRQLVQHLFKVFAYRSEQRLLNNASLRLFGTNSTCNHRPCCMRQSLVASLRFSWLLLNQENQGLRFTRANITESPA
jgi:hypothetical protein